eukprot:293580-Pelagomonas_calceolata.AAC.1
MDTKAKSSHTADNVFGTIQVEIFGQNIRRICNVCRLGWESTPSDDKYNFCCLCLVGRNQKIVSNMRDGET